MGGVFTFRAVYDGYRACRRRKRGTANAQRYELRLLDHLVDTAQALQDRDYVPSRSLCFVVRQPKAREIHAADFSDRVALFGDDLARALAAAPWIGRWRQTRAETRNGLGAGYSWPLSHLKGLGKSLRRAGLSYGFVAEQGYLPGGMKRRVLRYFFVGPSPSPSARADPGRDTPPTLGPVGPTATSIMPNPST